MKKSHKEMYGEMMGHLMKKLYKKKPKSDGDADDKKSAVALASVPAPDGEKLEESDVEETSSSKKRKKGKMVVGFGGK